MAEANKHRFINFGTANPRPTSGQRREVAKYIGQHYRNRSAPAQRTQQTHTSDVRGAQAPRLVPDGGLDGRQVARRSRLGLSANTGGPWSRASRRRPPDSVDLQGYQLQADQLLLLRPVVERLVPDYPTDHRDKVFDVLDFRKSYFNDGYLCCYDASTSCNRPLA